MPYPLTRRLPRGTILALAFSGMVSTNSALAAGGAGEDAPLAPHAAAGSVLLEDLEIRMRPQTYPGLPSADPFDQDPEQIRQALRRDVEQALAEAPELADEPILVHVTSLRRARLSGIVDSESTRILAELIAASVEGISGVDNRLSVEAEQD